jgi:hypothetical protein
LYAPENIQSPKFFASPVDAIVIYSIVLNVVGLYPPENIPRVEDEQDADALF